MEDKLIIVRYGEISLKSSYVRKNFVNILIKNIKKGLSTENISNEIKKERGRIYIFTEKIDLSLNVLKKIFGIVSFSPSIKTNSDLNNISKKAVEYSKGNLKSNTTFAIRSKRTGNHEFTSQDVSIKVGDEIVKNYKSKVDLSNPDYEVFIEVRSDDSYIYDKIIKGPGGMPVGSQDKILSIIDEKFSFLSSWYLLRRGCKVIFLTKKEFQKDLNYFCKKFYIKNDYFILEKNKDLFFQINEISEKNFCKAVVSSIYNLKDEDLNEIKDLKKYNKNPVLYPLISMNKDEINKKIKQKEITLWTF